jgi:hypothetical protein
VEDHEKRATELAAALNHYAAEAAKLREALQKAEAHLSLLRYRASIRWGSPGLPESHETDQVIGMARRVLYG